MRYMGKFIQNNLHLAETDIARIIQARIRDDFHTAHDIFDVLAKYKIYLCGGAITNILIGRRIADLDFYAETVEDADNFIRYIRELRSDEHHSYLYGEIFTTVNAITFKNTDNGSVVQVIKRFNGLPCEIFKTFDFSCVCFAYSFELNQFFWHKDAVADVIARRLNYISSKYPICALFRIKKYVKKGFSISRTQIIRILKAISELRIHNYGELKIQLMGIDTVYVMKALEVLDRQDDEAVRDFPLFIQQVMDCLDSYSPILDNEDDETT